MSVWIDSNSDDDELFEIVFQWIDVLSNRNYELVANELGYLNFDLKAATEAIRDAIESYTSPELFPDVEDFRVSNWRLATGGNPHPSWEIVRFNENAVGIVAS